MSGLITALTVSFRPTYSTFWLLSSYIDFCPRLTACSCPGASFAW